MRVIVLVSEEKGVGKSLLARHLAAAGRAGGGRPAAVVAADHPHLEAELERLFGAGTGLAILDVPTVADPARLAAVLPWVDLVLIPVRPSRARLARLGSLVRRIEAAAAPFAFVVNQASPRHTFTGAYAMALAQHGTVCPVAVPRDPGLAAAGDGTAATVEAQQAIAALAAFIDRLLVRIAGADDAQAAPAAVDRRQFCRWSLDWEAVVERGNERFPCRLIDLSGGGAGFECAAPLAEGDAIGLDVPGIGHFAAVVVAAFGGRVGARLALDAQRQWQLATLLATRMQAIDAGAEAEPAPERAPEPSDQPAPESAVEPAAAAAVAPRPAPRALADVAGAPAADRLRGLNRALAVATAAGEPGRLIVIGNEKGGSGKSTVAVHLLIALLKEGFDVASVDLDGRQATLSRYLDNRRAFAAARGTPLPMPAVHELPDGQQTDLAFSRFLTEVSSRHDFVVVDTPGRDARLGRLAHLYADVVVTPINDSFLDLDVIARIDAERRFAGPGPYGALLAAARDERAARDGSPDWIVLRNRLSTVLARNKAEMAEALARLAPQAGFRVGPGLTERVIYRELFPFGLTLLDLREDGVGVALTVSHLAARQEVRSLLRLVLEAGGARPAARQAEAVAAPAALPRLAMAR